MFTGIQRGCQESGRLWPLGLSLGTVADVSILNHACWLKGVLFFLSNPVFCTMIYYYVTKAGECLWPSLILLPCSQVAQPLLIDISPKVAPFENCIVVPYKDVTV